MSSTECSTTSQGLLVVGGVALGGTALVIAAITAERFCNYCRNRRITIDNGVEMHDAKLYGLKLSSILVVVGFVVAICIFELALLINLTLKVDCLQRTVIQSQPNFNYVGPGLRH